MALPIQSVKHVRGIYQKYLIITISCAVLTAVAAFLAAISSFQLSSLNKSQKAVESVSASAAEKAAEALHKEVERLKKNLTETQSQLDHEKSTSKELRAKVIGLQKQLEAIAIAASAKQPEGNSTQEAEQPQAVPAPAMNAPSQPAATPEPTQNNAPDKPKSGPQSSAAPVTPLPAKAKKTAVPQARPAKIVAAPLQPAKPSSTTAEAAQSPVTAPKTKPTAIHQTSEQQPVSEQKLPDQANPAPTTQSTQ